MNALMKGHAGPWMIGFGEMMNLADVSFGVAGRTCHRRVEGRKEVDMMMEWIWTEAN
jgi:hypothetical protein